MQKINVALLASRSGQNASWIVKAANAGKFPFRVSLVICNGAGACRARRFNQGNIPVISIDSDKFDSRALFERRLLEILAEFDNPLAVSCSFNRLLSGYFLDAYPNYIINSHPSLLPAFPGRVDGLKPVDAAIHYGVKIAGATVHFIDSGMDTGPIIMQGAVPCPPNESNEDIIARILRLEALLKISTLCYFGEDRVFWDKGSRHVSVNYDSEAVANEVYRKMNTLIFPPPLNVSAILPILDGDAS